MASPHVTGVIALVRDLHPDWGYAQVINQVLQTVDPVSSMDGKTVTGGRLNAASAVGVEVVPSPEIQVLLGTLNIADGSAVIHYGNTPPGLAIDYTFTDQEQRHQATEPGRADRGPRRFQSQLQFRLHHAGRRRNARHLPCVWTAMWKALIRAR